MYKPIFNLKQYLEKLARIPTFTPYTSFQEIPGMQGENLSQQIEWISNQVLELLSGSNHPSADAARAMYPGGITDYSSPHA